MSTLTIYKKEAWYDLLSAWRTPGFVLPALLFPVVFYGFFGIMLAGAENADYMLVTYGCFGIMGPAMFNFAMNIASDRAHGWLTLKRLSPMPMGAYLTAKLVTSTVFSLVIVGMLYSLAVFVGGVQLSLGQWLALAVTLLIGTLPFALIGLLLGLTLSDKAAPGAVNLIYLPMAFLSGLWVPITMLPEAIQHLSWLWPSFHLSQLGLKVLGMSQGHPIELHLGLLALWSGLLVLVIASVFRRQNG